jgi:hypothetical protein
VALVLVAASAALTGCAPVQNGSAPFCPRPDRNAGPVILMAQSVPTAAYVPCISKFPAGWTFGGQRIRNDRSEFWLDSDRAGPAAVKVFLTRACDLSGAVEVNPEPGEPPMRRYQEPNLPPTFQGNRYYVFPGGCVTYRFSFSQGAKSAQALEAIEALTFVDRAKGVKDLAELGVILCGRGVRCPG